MGTAMVKAWPRRIRALAGWLALGLGTVFLALWIGASVPRNPGWQEAEDGIPILVETNGIHTGLVVPIVTPEKDWRTIFPHIQEHNRYGEITHLAIGWGEQEVFLNTPTWGDLRAATALRIAVAGGDSVMRLHPLVRPVPGPWHRALRLRPEEYARLARAIAATLPPPGPDGLRQPLTGFDPDAIHYPALGRYTLLYGCNQWVSDVLAEAGVRVGWFTPLASGVTRWFPPPNPHP